MPRIPGGGGLVDTWTLDANTYEVVIADGIAYVSGAFEVAGPATGAAALVDLSSGTVSPDFPVAAGDGVDVYAVTADGTGGWILAGSFSNVDGVARQGLARIRADGTLDPDFNPIVQGFVGAMTVADGVLYVGGAFSGIDGQPRSHLAALDPMTGSVSPWNPGANNEVTAIAAVGNRVFVGGRFDQVGGLPRSRIAAVDVLTGGVSGWAADISGSRVDALAVDGTTLYVGGVFSTIGGISRRNLAAVDVDSAAVSSWDPGLSTSTNADVEDLATHAGTLYVVGNFTTLDGGVPRNRAGAFDIASGALTAWNPDVNARVQALAATSEAVYLGGIFRTVGGLPRLRFAAVDPLSGAAQPLDLPAARDVLDLAVDNGRLLVGGRFAVLGGVRRDGLAAFDLATGALTDWAPSTDGTVNALAVNGSAVYLGGFFSLVNGEARSHLAAVDRDSGATLPWNPVANGQVVHIEIDENNADNIYVGGGFTEINGQARSRLAELDASGALSPWAPNPDRVVYGLAVSPSVVYVSLEDSVRGGGATVQVAYDRGTAAVTGWSPVVDRFVGVMQRDNQGVLMGGFFSQVGGQPRLSLAEVDEGAGAVTTWDAALPPDSFISGIQINGPLVGVSGAMDPIPGEELGQPLAIFSRDLGTRLWAPDVVGFARAIALTPTLVAAVGNFTEFGRGYWALYCHQPIFDDGFE
ncbi:MAG: hypothetical protein KDI71_05230 [Xanthomonadales bacterium]|nr:hypothetical protein [Xanthomonadales bacterium]